MAQPELSRRIYKLIKLENNVVHAYVTAGRERAGVANQLSEWGEQTGDDAINDISDKIGVLLCEIGDQEEKYARSLEDSRSILKQIRDTEKSVQPSRDQKFKLADDISRVKGKEPDSQRLMVLEQELVRAEAENLVAEAQLTNITRQKLKEAFSTEFAATIERSEKQIILAKHGYRLLSLLDDSPVVPGDDRKVFAHSSQARQILNDAEDDLGEWHPEEMCTPPPRVEEGMPEARTNENKFGKTGFRGGSQRQGSYAKEGPSSLEHFGEHSRPGTDQLVAK